MGAGHRTLRERAAGGATLVSERGALARFEVRARPASADGHWEAHASVAQGRLDYEGQTQSGLALATASSHTEHEVGLRWRPLAPSAWGEVRIGLDGLRLRRRIASTPTAGGITETATLVLPVIAWRTPAFQWGPAVLRAEAHWRASVRHELNIDYLGVFDRSRLAGGRRFDLGLRLTASIGPAWQVALQWSHARQPASETAALYRGGVAAGTVRQPQLRIDDLGLTLSRRF